MLYFILGFLLIFGGTGGIENSTSNSTTELFVQIGIVLLGFILMILGVRKFNQ